MNVNLIGSFVFISQGYGILSSIYNNVITSDPHPETAKRIKNNNPNTYSSDLYDGIYKTIWLEPSSDDKTDLEIKRQQDGSYKLRWYVKKITYYEGIGFIRNNELVGSYWQMQTPNS